MVLYVSKWNIRPEKADEYPKWAKSALQRLLAVPGVTEFRGFRPVTGAHQVAVTYEFADFSAWAVWNGNDAVQEVWNEAREYCANLSIELWGPSPLVPDPIRPGNGTRSRFSSGPNKGLAAPPPSH